MKIEDHVRGPFVAGKSARQLTGLGCLCSMLDAHDAFASDAHVCIDVNLMPACQIDVLALAAVRRGDLVLLIG